MSQTAPHPSVPPAPAHAARRAVAVLAAVLAACPCALPARAASIPPPANLQAAEAMAQQPPSKDRDRALEKWGQNAPLVDLVYLLRLPQDRLGDVAADLAKSALRAAPESRSALRVRLEALEARARGRVMAGGPAHLDASVFRVAAMLPDSGDFGNFGRAVLKGLAVGIDAPRTLAAAGEGEAARALLGPATAPAYPIEIEPFSVDGDPGPLLSAFDAAAPRDGAIVGELLSVPTMILGTAARYAGIPLVSPTATDENTGATGPGVFQVGPSGTRRADALARVTVVPGRRVAILVSSAYEDGFFSRAFAGAAQRLGGTVVWRHVYAAGNADFRAQARSLAADSVGLLFWDGDAREAEALLRQLARDKVSVAICGGPALDPEQHHAELRLLLEGVTYAGEEWRLRDPVAGALDRTGFYEGSETDLRRSLRVRGFLAGQAIRSAVEQGALCPEEIVARLSQQVLPEPSGLGFLDFGAIVEVPVMRVQRGEPVAVQ